jgi:hypothetical protein
LTKQQKWNHTLSCWGIKRALLVSHDAQVNTPNNLLNLTDYIDAFYHHCEQGNYQFALDTLKAGDDLFNQPENHEKRLELYDYLSEILKN